mmetsp:Transcript_28650/g.43813  ORF Transcript_28650/g.43813 Transcript_28650/m.43813 type:complete len:80 (-) Transcript_28650:108-347(-)
MESHDLSNVHVLKGASESTSAMRRAENPVVKLLAAETGVGLRRAPALRKEAAALLAAVDTTFLPNWCLAIVENAVALVP